MKNDKATALEFLDKSVGWECAEIPSRPFSCNLVDVLELMQAYAETHRPKWPSDEDLDLKFPSTYAQINYIRKPGVTLNRKYLEEHGIDFMDNYHRKQGAKWLRSKLFGEEMK